MEPHGRSIREPRVAGILRVKSHVMFFLFFLAGAFGMEATADEALVDFRVIVHATNPVESLPREDVAKMFRLQIRRWKDWDDEPRVEPVDHKLGAAVRLSFTLQVHGRSLQRVQSYWHRKVFSGRGVPPPTRDSDEEVIQFVSRMEGGIGYIEAGTPLPETVKELRLVD